jgi:hypothetical protein
VDGGGDFWGFGFWGVVMRGACDGSEFPGRGWAGFRAGVRVPFFERGGFESVRMGLRGVSGVSRTVILGLVGDGVPFLGFGLGG